MYFLERYGNGTYGYGTYGNGNYGNGNYDNSNYGNGNILKIFLMPVIKISSLRNYLCFFNCQTSNLIPALGPFK